jgi:hypothetical protein
VAELTNTYHVTTSSMPFLRAMGITNQVCTNSKDDAMDDALKPDAALPSERDANEAPPDSRSPKGVTLMDFDDFDDFDPAQQFGT